MTKENLGTGKLKIFYYLNYNKKSIWAKLIEKKRRIRYGKVLFFFNVFIKKKKKIYTG